MLGHIFRDWESSIHGKSGIGCQSCHGGDADLPDKARAHAGLPPSSDPRSPVAVAKIPETCGRCHSAEFEAFKRSRHAKTFHGDGRGPNCVTCHGSMANHIITSREMEVACNVCHTQPTQAYPARMEMESARGALRLLDKGISSAGKNAPAGMVKRSHDLAARFHDVHVSWHALDIVKVRADAREIARDAAAAYSELNSRK